MSVANDFGVLCGECGAQMVLRTTLKHTYPNGQARRFWGCSRFPECGGIHGAHPDGAPMGVPADRETRGERVAAHAVFDAAWRARGLTKHQAYLWLQEMTDMSSHAAHISRFDREQCRELVRRIHLAEAVRACVEDACAALNDVGGPA